MPYVISTRERGFTLIEMSIVLIIIGLIIGGILKGQELIESARQKNFIAQTDSIKAGTNSFVDRFRAFPGDYNVNPCPGTSICVAGNNNGVLNAVPAATTVALAALPGNALEQYEYFNMLVGAGFIGGGSAQVIATGSTAFSGGAVQSPMPQASFPQSGITIAYGTQEGAVAGADSRTTHWLRTHRFGTAATPAAGTGVISPARMLQLDTKYDDSLPSSGRIRTDYTISGGATAGDCGVVSTAGGYSATVTVVACNIYMTLE
jgi:prepilin-type N-terminal cleavage/methylation domain-containing protein